MQGWPLNLFFHAAAHPKNLVAVPSGGDITYHVLTSINVLQPVPRRSQDLNGVLNGNTLGVPRSGLELPRDRISSPGWKCPTLECSKLYLE